MPQEHSDATRAILDAWWQHEPLCFEWIGHGDTHARFEFSSRGDRVEGRLHARSGTPQPLILFVAGGVAGAGDALAEACARQWSESGAAVARLDLPLHGARESAKLSAALREAASDLERLGRDPDRERLVAEFLRQTHWDVRGAIAGLGAEPAIDATRVACVGSELGALACAHACAETEVAALVLAHAPKGGPPRINVENAAQTLAPRTTLWIDAPGAPSRRGAGERIEAKDAENLANAAWPFLKNAIGL